MLASIFAKAQAASVRGRILTGAAELQTINQKIELMAYQLLMPGYTKYLLDVVTVPIAYYNLYKLFGIASIAACIVVNLIVNMVTTKLNALKAKELQKERSLIKKQESLLQELAGHLDVWKVYGWADRWCKLLRNNASSLEQNSRWQTLWSTLGEVLPQALGPISVLVSVGVDVLLGGKIELVKLVTASSCAHPLPVAVASSCCGAHRRC